MKRRCMGFQAGSLMVVVACACTAPKSPRTQDGSTPPRGPAIDGSAPDAGGVASDAGGEDEPHAPSGLDAASALLPDAALSEGPRDGDELGEIAFAAWPGDGEPTPADAEDTFGGNLSGLTHEPATLDAPERMWAVQNNPAMLFRLERDEDGQWAPPPGDWQHGKQLRYPDGAGSPDAEGVTRAEPGTAVYVATERDNEGEENRLSILRFDTRPSGDGLTATHEWNLTDDLPSVDSNAGLEAITWVPDAHLTLQKFWDEGRSEPYDPARYPAHGQGLFFAALEANGTIYAYALNHDDGSAARVQTIASGQAQVMGLEFDHELGTLWAHCDDGCGNRATVLAIASSGTARAGRFVVRKAFEPPESLADLNNEGIAFSDCRAGERSFFWADDGETDGHAIRTGIIPCASGAMSLVRFVPPPLR